MFTYETDPSCEVPKGTVYEINTYPLPGPGNYSHRPVSSRATSTDTL